MLYKLQSAFVLSKNGGIQFNFFLFWRLPAPTEFSHAIIILFGISFVCVASDDEFYAGM